ncbi:MAG TPA: RNA polymerase subunit sigma-24, partial [Marisediminicola sp.]|nr:RNA polymerase subunit sigma-24 [Marisediminicola sp.]
LGRSAAGDRLTAHHVEAAIAACHAIAPSFEETDWRAIAGHYDQLLELKPTAVVALNRAVALSMADGPHAGLAAIEAIPTLSTLRDYLPLSTTLGELWLRAGDKPRAAEHFTRALELPATLPEKRFLLRKLAACR